MKFTFKPFSGDKTSPDTSADSAPNLQTKRKDQIRRAQKTHRERKEAYTKSLEIEVVQLRANESKILQETKGLYTEITVLKKLLTNHGIPIPARNAQGHLQVEYPGQDAFDLSIVQDINSKHGQRRLRAERYAGNEALPNSVQRLNISHSTSGNPKTTLGEFDTTAIGIEFVLSLESPCLDHIIQNEIDAGSTATGHSLMTTATLLHQHPTPYKPQLNPSSPPWQVSAAGIERLLQLSDSIALPSYELTPVQVWDQLRRHPQFEVMELAQLQKLKETLLKHVKCHGFGGAIDQALFNDSLFQVFVVGRVFQPS